jgi:LmbE family N-acetylglucosaminyl deacetylase
MKSMRKNVLFVGAHPDDIEIGCGGAISKHLNFGDNVFVLILTHGEMGNHPPKLNECMDSLKLLNIKQENIIFGNFSDGFLKDDCHTVNFIEKFIKRFEINRIYTHHHNDRHQDHRNCSNAVSAASRKNIPEILLFQGPSTKVPFEPHYFIGISEDDLNKKINALKCYETQIKKGILNVRIIKSIAEVHGFNHHTEYAEAFEINHFFKGKNEI